MPRLLLSPMMLLAAASGTDLSGVWTGSPAGSPREIMLAQRSAGSSSANESRYELLCRTTDYQTSHACSWESASCVVAGTAVHCEAPVGSGVLGAAGDTIAFSGGPDTRFTGALTGIWASASDADADAYFLLHNASTNAVTAWWDAGVSPRGAWSWGAGVYTPARPASKQNPRPALCGAHS